MRRCARGPRAPEDRRCRPVRLSAADWGHEIRRPSLCCSDSRDVAPIPDDENYFLTYATFRRALANELCTICAPSFHASDGEDSSIRLPLHPIHDFCGAGEERGQAMQAFKNTLFASVGALLISAAPVA